MRLDQQQESSGSTQKTNSHRLLCSVLLFCAVTSHAHDAHHNSVPWDVCKNKKISETCAFKNSDHDEFKGTCQAVSEQLICVRNQPIIKAKKQLDSTHNH